ncbi:hypothetical protein [Aidingimonas halophila]|uniref:Uncharacterized protein n=1 Tax=Aidingimonas halophila TaxID=574349 RepID=A0A1H3HL34_9GAMM|nr:hypothetical protein [Aidingimonas halophila]GHC37118.1 hypothetical protein GCM10008094_33000 [Aidingimonas halophila]SDY15514.1 hypothetical protein SAMN05443545_11233 [Aidingimonas halophila]
MAGKSFDRLRALAIATQAVGFVTIITLETLLGDAARSWQALTLGGMLAAALSIAVARLYQRNKQRKFRDRARHDESN